MAQKLEASFPEGLDLDQNYIIRFTAVDATTGAVVTAVKVSSACLLAGNLMAVPAGDFESGPFMLVPGPEA